MIVRLQQFPVRDAEQIGGWPECGAIGRIAYDWPEDTGAFEVVVAETDENGRPVAGRSRRDHLKSMIPTLAQTFKEPQEIIIARLDGPCAPGELLAALNHLPQVDAPGRFALSSVEKLDASPGTCFASVRMEMDFERLETLCADPGLNLETSVRLRLFCVPEELVNTLLQISDPNDERWREILPRTSSLIQPAGGMDSIQIITSRYTLSHMREKMYSTGT
jgi:hypothetical protein